MSNKSSIMCMPLTGRLLLPSLIVVFLVVGCGVFPESVSVDDCPYGQRAGGKKNRE
jgi:hypothetical protein